MLEAIFTLMIIVNGQSKILEKDMTGEACTNKAAELKELVKNVKPEGLIVCFTKGGMPANASNI